jgi:hypothetical protein
MSDVSQGEGWWVASDGRWYPPQDHPNDRAGSRPWRSVPEASSDSAGEPSTDRSAVAVATARKCVNGHEMPESHVFCSVCGSKRNVGTSRSTPWRSVSPDPQVVTGTCASGHVMEESQAYCSVCGGVRNAGPAKSEVSGHSTDRPTAPSALSPYARAALFAVIGVIAIIIIIIILVMTLGGGAKSQSYKDGWNTALGGTYSDGSSVDCNNDTAPNGDNQGQWQQGCNDGSNAANNALSGGTTPTTFP